MLSHTGEKPFICKQCNYLFVYLHIRHPGTSFLRSSYNYIFKNIAYVIVYVWPSRTWDEILLPFQKGLFFPLGDIRLFLPTRIRICAYAHHPTWIRHGRIRMAIPNRDRQWKSNVVKLVAFPRGKLRSISLNVFHFYIFFKGVLQKWPLFSWRPDVWSYCPPH